MPKISEFEGMAIYMHYDETPWPHIHAYGQEEQSFFAVTFPIGDSERTSVIDNCPPHRCDEQERDET